MASAAGPRVGAALCVVLLLAAGCAQAPSDPYLGRWRVDDAATLARARADGVTGNALAFYSGLFDKERLEVRADALVRSYVGDSHTEVDAYRRVGEQAGCRLVEFAGNRPRRGQLCLSGGRLIVEIPLEPPVLVYRRD